MINSPPTPPGAVKPALSLVPEPAEGWRLRSIAPQDQDLLRAWKNLHRRSFFYQDIITPQMQEQWFAGYLQRPHDWLFMVLDQERPAGCLGWRLWQGRADLYNLIRGDERGRGDGLMSKALTLLMSHLLAEGRVDIVARVLHGNPARAWYERNGFVLEAEEEDHFLLRLDQGAFTSRAYNLISGDKGSA